MQFVLRKSPKGHGSCVHSAVPQKRHGGGPWACHATFTRGRKIEQKEQLLRPETWVHALQGRTAGMYAWDRAGKIMLATLPQDRKNKTKLDTMESVLSSLWMLPTQKPADGGQWGAQHYLLTLSTSTIFKGYQLRGSS